MSFQVVELICQPLQFLLGLAFGISCSEHLLVVGVDQIYQLSLVSRFLIFVFSFGLVILVS